MDFNYDMEEYPTHIIIPKNYWVYSYTLSESNND